MNPPSNDGARLKKDAVYVTGADVIAELREDPAFAAEWDDAQIRTDLVAALVQLRERSGLSQRALAKQIGVSPATLCEFEVRGGDPKLSTLQRYARALEHEVHPVVIPAAGTFTVMSAPNIEGVVIAGTFASASTIPRPRDESWIRAADTNRASFAKAS